MKRCGRLNSATARWRYSWRGLCLSRFLDRGCQTLRVVRITLVAASIAVPVFAASSAGSVRASSPPSTATSPALISKTDSNSLLAQSTDATGAISEIPPVVPDSQSGTVQSAPGAAGVASPPTDPVDYDDGIIRYEHAKNSDMTGPPIGTLDDFMSEGDITSPLGFEVREDKRRLKSGGEAQGLLIVDVFAGSPAARAGLHPYHRAMRDVLETAAVAGAMFVPPVVLLVPVFDQVRLGESYDLIIGVDGSRVTNFLDFQERLRDLQPGEIVYFSIVRNGARMQIPVPVPANPAGPRF
jgi:PDZ domain